MKALGLILCLCGFPVFANGLASGGLKTGGATSGVSGSFSVGGNLAVSGDAAAGGAVTAATIHATGAATLDDDLTVTGTTHVGTITGNSGAAVTVSSGPADGANVVAVHVGSSSAYANASAKLLAVENAGTAKAYFKTDGALIVSGVTGTNVSLGVPAGTRISLNSGTDTALLFNNGSSIGVSSLVASAGIVGGDEVRADGWFKQSSKTLDTCSAGAASRIEQDATGGTGGKRTKYCVCSYDGTTAVWLNLFTGSAGTTTTCPDTP